MAPEIELLTDSEIEARLRGTQWRREGDTIVREFVRPDFAAAIDFVIVVAELAEQANHHPDILIHGYKQVRLTLTTHSAGGVTERDFELARAVDTLA
jgi:4a-hydroxytetrahydrobiopterin dehydratase